MVEVSAKTFAPRVGNFGSGNEWMWTPVDEYTLLFRTLDEARQYVAAAFSLSGMKFEVNEESLARRDWWIFGYARTHLVITERSN